MTAFRFRLERVRALRERGEDMAKQELAGALTARESSEDALRQTGEELAGARESQRDANAIPMSALDLVARQRYLERLEDARVAAQADLTQKETEVESRRVALHEAARERQALERLKERQRRDHARELARIEGAALDEIALTLHRRAAQ